MKLEWNNKDANIENAYKRLEERFDCTRNNF